MSIVAWCGVVWCPPLVFSFYIGSVVLWYCGGVLTWEDVDGASYSALSKYLRLLTGSDDTTVPPLQTQRM